MTSTNSSRVRVLKFPLRKWRKKRRRSFRSKQKIAKQLSLKPELPEARAWITRARVLKLTWKLCSLPRTPPFSPPLSSLSLALCIRSLYLIVCREIIERDVFCVWLSLCTRWTKCRSKTLERGSWEKLNVEGLFLGSRLYIAIEVGRRYEWRPKFIPFAAHTLNYIDLLFNLKLIDESRLL